MQVTQTRQISKYYEPWKSYQGVWLLPIDPLQQIPAYLVPSWPRSWYVLEDNLLNLALLADLPFRYSYRERA